MTMVYKEMQGARITCPVVALALDESGAIRPVVVKYLPNENVGGVSRFGPKDALVYPPKEPD